MIGGRYLQVVAGLIGGAENYIQVAMFQMMVRGAKAKTSSRQLAEELAAKGLAGVEVRVLLNAAPGKAAVAAVNKVAAKWLVERKVRVRSLGARRVCHAKLVIIDRRIAVIGSHNWGVGAMRVNLEVSVVLDELAEVRRLAQYFDGLWAVCRPLLGWSWKERDGGNGGSGKGGAG